MEPRELFSTHVETEDPLKHLLTSVTTIYQHIIRAGILKMEKWHIANESTAEFAGWSRDGEFLFNEMDCYDWSYKGEFSFTFDELNEYYIKNKEFIDQEVKLLRENS